MKEKLYRFLKRMEATTDVGILAMDRRDMIELFTTALLYIGFVFVLVFYLPAPFDRVAGFLMPVGILVWMLSCVVISLIEDVFDIPLWVFFHRRRKEEEKQTYEMEEIFLDPCEGAIETAIPDDLRSEYYRRVMAAMRLDHSHPYEDRSFRELLTKPWGKRDRQEKVLGILAGLMLVLMLAAVLTMISAFIF